MSGRLIVSSPSSELQWVHWGDQYVVFHRPSGKTHFVNEATWLLLADILTEPRDAASAVAELAARQGLQLDEAARTHVDELLTRLEEIGLVVPA